MNREFWNKKKVLVTGHTGFKGTWLALWLQSLGAAVTGYALPPPTSPSLFALAHGGDGIDSRIGDIRDLARFQAVCAEAEPEIVLHLAAQALVRESYRSPVETYATNVMGTVHVLEAIRHTPSVRAAVVVTSDKCYQNREWVWGYREDEPMGGFDPYSNSKGCAELVTAAFRSSYFASEKYPTHGVAIATARAGNVIGGGDWAADRLVPDILQAMLEGRSVSIRSPHAIRPWQHVLEPLSGYLLLAERLYQHGPDYAEAWNFGPAEEDARPVSWIVDHLTRQWEGAAWELDAMPQPHEAHYLKLDCSKARARLGWEPRLRLTDALDWISEWYRGYQRGDCPRDLTLAQIRRYETMHL